MRVPLVYLPCCPVPNCLGKQGELSGNCLPNLTVRFILSPSTNRILLLSCASAANTAARHLIERGKLFCVNAISVTVTTVRPRPILTRTLSQTTEKRGGGGCLVLENLLHYETAGWHWMDFVSLPDILSLLWSPIASLDWHSTLS